MSGASNFRACANAPHPRPRWVAAHKAATRTGQPNGLTRFVPNHTLRPPAPSNNTRKGQPAGGDAKREHPEDGRKRRRPGCPLQ